MIKRHPLLDQIWSAKIPNLIDLLTKSGFDTSRIANFSFELNTIRGPNLETNYPPNQSILFNPQFRMDFHHRKFQLSFPENKKFKINLTKDLHQNQLILNAGFPEPHSLFTNLRINNNIAGSIIDLKLKNKQAEFIDEQKFIILPSLPLIINAATIDFFKRLNDFIITELNWKPIESIKISPKISIIGTDPEFELIQNGDVVRARDYFDSHEIGCDGTGNQLELRPKPSDDIELLVNNIKSLFEKVTNKSFSIGTTGNSLAIGSHIHFGGINYTPYPDYNFIHILNKWLYEKLTALNGSARGHFGQPSDQRRKTWGFEYRSLPSGIFITPLLTKAVFKTAKCLADKWWNFEPIAEIPTEENYLEFLSSDETNIIFNAKKIKPSNSQKSLKNFIANWGLKIKSLHYATLNFRDEWPTRASNYSQLKCYFGNCTIVLFGLKKKNTYSITDKTGNIPETVIEQINQLFQNQDYIQPITKTNFEHKKEDSIDADLIIGIPPEFRKGNIGVSFILQKIENILWPE